MDITRLAIPEVVLISPRVFGDDRGVFFESYNHEKFNDLLGLDETFVQDNQSRSSYAVLRGLHYQLPPKAQGKLVRAVEGEMYDVAVDIRAGSATFGQWVGAVLSAQNRRQLWVPAGFAHGFLVLSSSAVVLYKTTDYYAPEYERSISWDDPDIGIDWPFTEGLVISERDLEAGSLADADLF